jgi:two-component system cell cycle response regulator CtrA
VQLLSGTGYPLPARSLAPLAIVNEQSETEVWSSNLETRIASADDEPVRLTGREYCILELLCLRKGTIVTKEMLLGHLYRGRDAPELKIIDVFVCHLRKKLTQATGGKHYIETVWGRGYRLRPPAAEIPPLPDP